MYEYDNVNDALQGLCADLLKAPEQPSRNGTMRELTHVDFTINNPMKRTIRLASRKHSPVAQIAETLWVLRGDNHVKWLARYLPRAEQFSDDGVTWHGAYGRRIRHYDDEIDQLEWIVYLLSKYPDTRRAAISIYNPVMDTDETLLDVPCNDMLTFIQRNGKVDAHVFVRSNDLIWGWSGINQFEWSVLLQLVAEMTGFKVGRLHFSITSLHLYERHYQRAKEITEDTFYGTVVSPRANVYSVEDLDNKLSKLWDIEYKTRNGLSAQYDDLGPLFAQWAEIFYRHHAEVPSEFLTSVDKLHREKDQAYGDSWKRRGEFIGILANIARKVDRLGHNGAGETATDTAIDLLVYLTKYRLWLHDQGVVYLEQYRGMQVSDHPDYVREQIQRMERVAHPIPVNDQNHEEEQLNSLFNDVEEMAHRGDDDRTAVVEAMMTRTYRLARTLWEQG